MVSRLKEFMFGTPEEISSRATMQQLQGRNRLGSRDRQTLAGAQGISRRLFIRQAIMIGGGVTVASVISGKFAADALEGWAGISEERKFFTELEAMSTAQKVAEIDQFYSKNRLTEEAARGKVIPIWLQHFIENGRSDIKAEEVLPEIQLVVGEVISGNQFGGVFINYATRTKGGPRFEFNAFPSDAPKKQGVETAQGIVFQRSIFTHEMGHYDTEFRNITEPAKWLISKGFLRTTLKVDHALTLGFNLGLVGSDGTYQIFFAGFDEAATDVRTAYISSKAGVPTVLSLEAAIHLRNFLGWIGYDLDRFVDLHRSSNLEQLARDFGKKVIEIHKLNTNDPEVEIMEGMKVIRSFNIADVESLEALFPTFKAAVLTKPRNYIVR